MKVLSVPGNLLLLGEYAVLEEGGLGLAAAVEPRVRLEASPAADLTVDGVWPGGPGGSGSGRSGSGESPFIRSAVEVVSGYLGAACTGSLRVDSSPLFTPGGRKAGLGSSAAVSVALVCGLLALAGRKEAARDPQAAALAVRAHRAAQGGRGSGYDVLASFNGGWGLFRGGTAPSWEPRRMPMSTGFVLFQGPAPVSTADAVRRYFGWKERNPGAAQDFLRDSNRAIQSFLSSRSTEESLSWFERSRRLGVELGTAIGVPGEIAVPPGLDARWCKSLGAGNELGVCLVSPDVELPQGIEGLRSLQLAETGVRWAP